MICVPLPRKRIFLVFPYPVKKHISLVICIFRDHTSLGICLPLPGKHISLVICVPLSGKHISLVICVPLLWKHISLVISVPLPRKHISLAICGVSLPGKHIYVPSDMCFQVWEHISLPWKHISVVICVSRVEEHISLVIRVPFSGKTHFTSDTCETYP